MTGELKTSLLVGTALTTAAFHTLIPDHWLPFVLIGRARRWTARTTLLLSGLSALIHAMVSLALGALAMALGLAWAQAIGESLERASAVLLVVFGLGYALWAWRKGGHFHPGGRLVHGGAGDEGCAGDDAASHPGHLHYHADEQIIHGTDRRSGVYLAIIVGVNPCILILPIMLSTVGRGAAAIGMVTLVYSATTVALMVGLSVFGVVATRTIPVPGLARHVEAASGVVVAAAGIVFLLVG